jgi:hypothetical protein
MCNGFGMIVDRELNAYFCEPDEDGDCSNTKILERLGWHDNRNQFTRRFVRVQCPDWKISSFEFDEDDSVPGWAEEHKDEIVQRVAKALAVCFSALAEYVKVRDKALTEYMKVRDPAWAEYVKVRATARAEYDKVTGLARDEYVQVCATARAEYEKVRDAARATMTASMSKIHGYVPAREEVLK